MVDVALAMNLRVVSQKVDWAVVRSMVGASLFVLAGLIWPVLRASGGANEYHIQFFPLMLGGATFLIVHVLSCVGLGPGNAGATASSKRTLRTLWGISAMTYAVMAYWYLAELARP